MAKRDINSDFSAQGIITCTQSGADTLTFGEPLNLGTSILENKAVLIKQIIYEFQAATFTAMNADGDGFAAAITTENGLTTLNWTDPRVRHAFTCRKNIATAVGYHVQELHKIYDLQNTYPGGGILAPATAIYLGVYSTGTGIANVVSAKLLFDVIELSKEDYQQLLKALQMFTA